MPVVEHAVSIYKVAQNKRRINFIFGLYIVYNVLYVTHMRKANVTYRQRLYTTNQKLFKMTALHCSSG